MIESSWMVRESEKSVSMKREKGEESGQFGWWGYRLCPRLALGAGLVRESAASFDVKWVVWYV